MAKTTYSGTGPSIDEARDALYKSAATQDVTGIRYQVKIGEATGEHKKYEKALAQALKAAGIGEYDPDTHSLEVTASGEVKVPGRASGAAPSRHGPDSLTDLL